MSEARSPKDSRMVHKLVKTTAQEMAGAYYEVRAGKHNLFYATHPNQKEFIRSNWKSFVSVARQVLGTMLNGEYDDKTKRDIYEALLEDSTLPYSPQEIQIPIIH